MWSAFQDIHKILYILKDFETFLGYRKERDKSKLFFINADKDAIHVAGLGRGTTVSLV